jgi:hypothetical protein
MRVDRFTRRIVDECEGLLLGDNDAGVDDLLHQREQPANRLAEDLAGIVDRKGRTEHRCDR